VLALVADLERLAVVAPAVADVAGHVNVGEKMHLDLGDAVALAGLAAPPLDVEREAPGVVAAAARFRHAGEELADRSEKPGVGRRVRARRAADRALVDAHHLVELLQPRDRFVGRRLGDATVKVPRDRGVQRVVNERGLPRTRYAGDAYQQPERQREIDVLQVVAARAADGDAILARTVAQARYLDRELARQIPAGERIGIGDDF